MEKVIELFALFLLALLGFVAPVLAIVLSIFAQGLAKLEQQYQTERSQTEDKLKSQLQKTGETATINIKEIERTIQELEKVKKIADRKLLLLSPKKALIFVCAPLITAFLLILPTFINSLPNIFIWLPAASLLLTIYSSRQLWNILDIILETMKLLESESKNEKRLIPDLLAEIVRNTKLGADFFIQEIFIKLDKLKIANGSNELKLDVNKKVSLDVRIINLDGRGERCRGGFFLPSGFPH